jgi:two-component sensor histidine kinase/ligand-binding sensor domain-containing protein
MQVFYKKCIKLLTCFELFVFTLLFGVTSLNGQIFSIKNYSTNNVLTTNNINTIHQTKEGFIWIGTNDKGLIRLNGKSTRNYSLDNGLRSNSINAIFQDSKSNLWIGGSTGGLGKLESDTVTYPHKDNRLQFANISHIYEDDERTLWVSTNGEGVFRIKNETEIIQINKSFGLRSDTVWSTWQYNNLLYIFANKGIHTIELDSDIYTVNSTDTTKDYYSAAEFFGKVWVGTSNGLAIIEDSISTIEEINKEKLGAVYGIWPMVRGELLIQSERLGLILTDGTNYIKASEFKGLSSYGLKSIYKDNLLRNWIITEDAGIDLVINQAILKYDSTLLGNHEVNAIKSFRDQLLVGSSEGLLMLQPFNYNDFISTKFIADFEVYDLEQISDTEVLVSSSNNELKKVIFKGSSVNIESINVELSDDEIITDLLVEGQTKFWIATNRGLYLKDVEHIVPISFTNNDSFINHLNFDQQNQLLVSTAKGLYVIENKLDEHEYLQNNEATKLLRGIHVRYAIQAPNQQYWIGTMKGVFIFDEDFTYITQLDHDDGIVSSNIQGITFSSDSVAFLATSAGIHKVEIESKNQFRLLHLLLDSKSSGANIHHAAILYNSPTVWAGSSTGLYSYSLISEPIQKGPEVYFSSISVDYIRNGSDRFSSLMDKQFSDNDIEFKTDLRHNENNLTFSFNGIDYQAPDDVTYSYRLLGYFDERWTVASHDNSVSFENLPSGKYRFEVKAINNRKIESMNVSSFSFNILPPFHKSSGFYALATMLLIGFIVGIERFRLKWLENNKLRDLVELRTLSLQENLKEREVLIQEVHHRTKNNLAVISGLLELQKSKIKDESSKHSLLQAQNRIQSIALIHEKLYKNETLSNINFKNYVHDLVEVIKGSYNYKDKDIQINLDIEDTIITIDQGIPCGLILNELVSNSYEHAFVGLEKGEIDISFKLSGEYVNYLIRDNGIGYPKDKPLQPNDSLGMTLVHTLTAQLDGKLEYLNSVGSTFLIKFKIEEY